MINNRKQIWMGIYILFLIFVVTCVLLPRWFGLQTMAMVSGSMAPNIPVGSLVYVKSTAADALKPGDICTYHREDQPILVTHRVVRINDAAHTLQTRGDANAQSDPLVDFNQVVGKVVFYLRGAGWWILWLRTPLGRASFLLGAWWIAVKLIKNEKRSCM